MIGDLADTACPASCDSAQLAGPATIGAGGVGERLVATDAIRTAVKGFENAILEQLGIRCGIAHIQCPYPGHDDQHPSWRWDSKSNRAYCSCIERSDDILDVVMKVLGVSFDAAKLYVAEHLGRTDLIKTKRGGGKAGRGQKADPDSLLNPDPGNRDDDLPYLYLAARLGLDNPTLVPVPTTKVVGIKSLGYYDPPTAKGRKPELVGFFPCAVFETIAADGRKHAHRVYLNNNGNGKADLGITAAGHSRDPKKSARLPAGQPSTAGLCVIWGDVGTAVHAIVAEGIENAAVIAYCFKNEIENGTTYVASAISTAGIRAFHPWPATTKVTVAADRDEGPGKDRAGEKAARILALKRLNGPQQQIPYLMALPGQPGTSYDFVDLLHDERIDAVRTAIFDAERITATRGEIAAFENREQVKSELELIKASYPLPVMETFWVEYALTRHNQIWIHKVAVKKNRITGEEEEIRIPVCSPFGAVALLDIQDSGGKKDGLRVCVRGRDGAPHMVDIECADLQKLGASEVRSRLAEAGLRFEQNGPGIAVQLLLAADPKTVIVTVLKSGWRSASAPLFMSPGGGMSAIGDNNNVICELRADVRLPPEVAYAGTMAGWQQAAHAAVKAKDCPHFTLGLAAGFVGPILQLCNFDTCGLHFSGFTSGGKTLAQKLAASCWSSPLLTSGGLLKSARTTENRVEHHARQSTGTVLGLDDLVHIDGKTVARLVYSLTSGVGKGRMQPSMQPQQTITWQTFVLLSFEQSLEQKINGDGGRWQAGIAVRIPNIDIDDTNKQLPRDQLDAIEGISHNFGHAGEAFVRALIACGHADNPDILRQRVLDNAALLAGEDADSARRRAAIPFALLVTAGTLAKEFGVLPAESDIIGAVKWGWARFCKSIEAESLDPSTQVLDNIRLWIAERWDSTCRHIGSTFHHLHKADAWYDTTTIYIPRATIGAAGGHILSTEALVKLLNDGGQLEKRDSSRRATVRYIPGVGRITAYALKRTRFGPTAGQDDEETS